jgi:hypothetical protein
MEPHMKRFGPTWTLSIAVCLVSLAAFAQGEAEEDPAPVRQPGVWVKDGEPVQTVPGMPLACRQRYLCNPSQAVMTSDTTRVKTTPAEVVSGACSVGGGPADECNVCLSNPPETHCEWWTEDVGED